MFAPTRLLSQHNCNQFSGTFIGQRVGATLSKYFPTDKPSRRKEWSHCPHSSRACMHASNTSLSMVSGCSPTRFADSCPVIVGRYGRAMLCILCIQLAYAMFLCPPAVASIGDAVATSLRQLAPDWVVVFVLASLPVVELRGAIPLGIAVFGLPSWLVFLLAVLGNTIIVPLILFSLPVLIRFSENAPLIHKPLNIFLERARKQTNSLDGGDVFWALAYFVAVPLPGTGAWSGAFISFVLGFPFSTAVLANFLGVCCAGVLVTGLVCMGWVGLWVAIITLLVMPFVRFLVRSMSQDPK